MISALWTGISGLSTSQTALDNESNNIANVNTIGYKASRISFADQMYQDEIGKGSTVQSAEKQYTQGNLQTTGVNYDMALSGDGFFVVSNVASNGTSQLYYTRAGNFRMGESGTLQDSVGNEVQGWAISSLDPDSDIVSTNSNVSKFTDDYSIIAGNQVVQYSSAIETYAAKVTDYTSSAKTDSKEVFSGAGYKTQSSKIADVEALISNYNDALEQLAADPDAVSSPSISQISTIDFPSGTDSLLNSTGDSIYVYIDGNKVSQNYIETTATTDFISQFTGTVDTSALSFPTSNTIQIASADDLTRYQLDIDGETIIYDAGIGESISDIMNGLQDAISTNSTISGTYTLSNDGVDTITLTGGTPTVTGATYASTLTIDYDVAASKVATYKALADEISNITGLKAYTVDSSNNLSTDVNDVFNGKIQIESLIPGDSFTIGDVMEVSGTITVAGVSTLEAVAVEGTGQAAVDTAMEALKSIVTGNQRDIYGSEDIYSDDDGNALSLDAGDTISYTIDGTTVTVTATATTTQEELMANLANTINSDSDLSLLVSAEIINGHLVVESKESGEEFNGILAFDDAGTSYTKEKDEDNSISSGANAEFLQLVTTIDQTTTQSSLQLRLDTLGLTDSAFGEFSVDENGVLYMQQDGVSFAIGQVSIALFTNDIGLQPEGDNLLSATATSGDPIFSVNNEGTASIQAETLELSTADLSESLVNLMVYQRAFEANSKSITTADSILQTLIQLKR